jgi:hypothetical protein
MARSKKTPVIEEPVSISIEEDGKPPIEISIEPTPLPTDAEVEAWAAENGFPLDELKVGRQIVVDFLRGVMNDPEQFNGDLLYSCLMTYQSALNDVVGPLENLNPGGLIVAINNATPESRPYLNILSKIYGAFGGWVEQVMAFEWIVQHADTTPEGEQSD